jgi:DNA polymerase-1
VNFQNMPRSDPLVKTAFLPKLDALLCIDYKQIEPRLLAYFLSITLGDDSLASHISSGEDPYTVIVEGFYGRSDITEKERQVGKHLFMSQMNGGGTPTIMKQLGVDYPEAKSLNEQFHRSWPGVRMIQDRINARVKERGYIETFAGRHLVPVTDHAAIPTLIQGTGADIMRQALVKVHEWTEGNLMASHIVLNTHDDIVIDSVESELPTLAEAVPQMMTDYPEINAVVPILAELEICRTNLAEKQPYEKEEYERVRERV